MKRTQTLFLVVFIIISCDRLDTINRGDFILIGDTKNMIYSGIINDTVRIVPWEPQDLFIDLDNDGVEDLKISTRFTPSPSGSDSHSAYISSIDGSLSISSDLVSDTLFRHFSIKSWVYTTPTYSKIIIEERTILSCYQFDSTYKVESIKERNKALILFFNDTLYKDDAYSLSTYEFENKSWSESEYINETADTVWLAYRSYLYDCDSLNKQTFYLGLRDKIDDDIRLGWIKLAIDDGIVFLESAIQN